MSQNTGDPVKSTPKASAPVAQAHDEDDTPAPVAKAAPASAPAAEGGDSRAQDILAMIRNRQK